MSKGIFSAALSGVVSLSLFSAVVFVTLKTASPADGEAAVSRDTGANLTADDKEQQTYLLLKYLNAGQANSPRTGLLLVEETNRTASVRQSIEADFQHREWFTGYGEPQFKTRQCASTGAGVLCDAAGLIPYGADGGQHYRNFTAQLIKTPKGWRVREFVIAPELRR